MRRDPGAWEWVFKKRKFVLLSSWTGWGVPVLACSLKADGMRAGGRSPETAQAASPLLGPAAGTRGGGGIWTGAVPSLWSPVRTRVLELPLSPQRVPHSLYLARQKLSRAQGGHRRGGGLTRLLRELYSHDAGDSSRGHPRM